MIFISFFSICSSVHGHYQVKAIDIFLLCGVMCGIINTRHYAPFLVWRPISG